MSRTDKDKPYSIRALQTGVIEHNHATGECIIGTHPQRRERTRILMHHRWRNECPRDVYVVECVHGKGYDKWQAKVDHARARHAIKTPVFIGFSKWGRSQALDIKTCEALDEMLSAGYYPDCKQEKTHLIDIREIELPTRDGEMIGLYKASAKRMFRARYDSSIPCKVCEANKPITCFAVETVSKSHYREDEGRDRNKRAAYRDSLRYEVKKFNTAHAYADASLALVNEDYDEFSEDNVPVE